MKLSVHTLVLLVLAMAVVVFALLIGAVFRAGANSSAESSCSASVLIRAGTAQAHSDSVDLRGCLTETKELGNSEVKVRKGLMDAYTRCKRMFGPARNAPLQAGDDSSTLCHVCGVYETELAGITGLREAIDRAEDGLYFHEKAASLFGNSVDEASESMPTIDPVGVMFVQSRDVQSTWFQRLLGPGGRWLLWVDDPDVDVVNGILIRPYVRSELEQLGCTRSS